MSLTSCLRKAGTSLSPDDKAKVLELSREYRQQGMKPKAAAIKAIDDQIADLEKLIEREAANEAKANAPQWSPADAEVPAFTMETRADGTLAVKGDAKAIADKLTAADITKFSPMQGGIMVGKTQAEKARAVLDGSNVRAMNEDGRAKDGKPINPGDVFGTLSGRETTPYPKQKGEKYASQWLIDNATQEAKSRGDDFNASIFGATQTLKRGDLTTADRESMLMYLFGEQPAVAPSILKPLTGEPKAETLTAPTKEDVLAQQEQADQAARDKEKADRAAEKKAAEEEDRKRIAKASEAAASTFELGGNAMDNLTGQGTMFSRATPAERDLVIQHNLTAENLLHADRMGGIAVPSMAITKADMPLQNFGEITLIGDKNMADPKHGIKAYGSDIYSPRYPQITYQIDGKTARKLNDLLADYRKDGEREIYGGEIDRVDNLISNKAFKAYADPKGDATWSDLKASATELLNKAGAEERIFQGFTYSGNRRYKAHTLENVIKILKKDLRGGENFNYGVGSLRAKFTPQFRSIEQIRKAKGNLMDKASFEAVKKEADEELIGISNDLDLSLDQTIEVLEDAPKMGVTRAIARAMKDYKQSEAEADDDVKLRVGNFLNHLRNMPTEYFEGKFLRSVGIGEFKAAVVPDNVKAAARAVLERDGVKVFTYKHGDDADRARVIKQAASETPDAMFRRTEFSTAAKSQATETIERQVEEITSNWANAPKVVVAFDMQDLRIPEVARREDQKQRSGGATGAPEGFFYKGTAYLMASQLRTQQDAARVLFHEALGHYGLRGAFGDSLNPILKQVAVMHKREVDAKMKEYGLRGVSELDRLTAAEEVLAELAQTRPNLGIVKRAIAAIRTWLRENIPGFKDLTLSDEELIRDYILPARGWVERGRAAMDEGVPAFIRGTNDAVTNPKDVVGNQGGRSADDISPGVQTKMVAAYNEELKRDGNDVPPGYYYREVSRGDVERSYGGGLDDVPHNIRAALERGEDVIEWGSDSDGGLWLKSEAPTEKEFYDDARRDEGWPSPVTSIGQIFDSPDLNEAAASAAFIELAKSEGWEEVGTGVRYVEISKPNDDPASLDEGYNDIRVNVRISNHSRTANATRPTNAKNIDINLAPQFGNGNEFHYADTWKTAVRKLRTARLDKDGNLTFPNDPPAPTTDGAPTPQTETEAFLKWFGDSKVVDADGKPLVVYHGTGADFSTFNSPMTWLSVSPKHASEYAEATGELRGGSPNVLPAYAKIVRPFDADSGSDGGYMTIKMLVDSAIAQAAEQGHAVSDADASHYRQSMQKTWNSLGLDDSLVDTHHHWSMVGRIGTINLRDMLQNMGFDGIIYSENAGFNGDLKLTKTFAVFGPRQIKSATGNTGAFDPENPDIRFSRGGTTTAPPGTIPPTGAQAGLFTPSIWSAPEATRTDRIIYELQDGRVDLKRVQQAIEKAGQQITEQWDARLAETLYPGRVAYRSKTFLDAEVKPLLKSMAMSNVSMTELADYLHARGAEERNKQIAKVNPDMPDGGAGKNSKGVLLTNDAARDYLGAISTTRKAVLNAVAKRVDAITAGTRKLLVSAGLETQDTIDAWEAAYKNYVPMFRDEAETGMPPHPQGSGFTVKGSASRRATGSTKEVTNILAHVLMQREAAITRAEKNRVATALYGMALAHPNPDFWTTIKPGMSNAAIADELVAMGVDPMLAEVGMTGVPSIRTVDPISGKVINRPNPLYKSMPGAIPLKIAGEDRVLMLNTNNVRAKRMAESLKNLDGMTQLDIAGSIVGKTTRWLAAVNTQYNPAFGLVNLTRDTLGGVINLGSTELRGKSLKILADTPSAIFGIARELAHGKQTGKWGKLYRQFVADGGQTGWKENWRDPNERAKEIEHELAQFTRGKLHPGRAVHAILDLLDGFNTTLENAVRLSAYKEALDQGISRAEAARLGRELTVDFNRKGRAGREFGPLYAFFNASVQGAARTIQTLRGPTGAKVIAGGVSLGILQALMLAVAGYEDDDLPEFVKTRALIIPLPGDEKKYIAIPYPLGLHVIPNTGRVLAELVLDGGKDIGRRTVDAIGEIAAGFNPLGGGNIFTAHGALTTAAPTVIDPIIDIGFNKNFAGTAIERQGFGGETDNRPGAARTRESTQRNTTGQVYLGISKAINFLTLGSDYEAGMVSPTPERIRYLAQTAGGGLLREIEKTINSTTAAAKGEKVDSFQIPIVGRFYGEVDDDRVQQGRYYRTAERLRRAASSLKAMEKAGDSEAFAKLMASNPDLALMPYLNEIQRSISELNRAAVQIIDNPKELQEIDAARTELMRGLNETVKEMERASGNVSLGDRLKPAKKREPATVE